MMRDLNKTILIQEFDSTENKNRTYVTSERESLKSAYFRVSFILTTIKRNEFRDIPNNVTNVV